MATKNIEDACKAIQDVWENIKNDFFEAVPGHYLELTCVYRSPKEQMELFKQGRCMGFDGEWIVQNQSEVVTNADGSKVKSAHNFKPARGIDVCVVDNQTGKWLWDPKWYEPLIEIAKRYGLVEGGSWRVLKDWPHIEVPNYRTYKEG